jgi:hypothetical protein
MRNLILALAFAASSFVAIEAHAATMTEQQVRNTCGGKLQSGSAGGSSAMGCEKNCGSKLCTYGCVTTKGKQTCSGEVVGRTQEGGSTGGNQRPSVSRFDSSDNNKTDGQPVTRVPSSPQGSAPEARGDGRVQAPDQGNPQRVTGEVRDHRGPIGTAQGGVTVSTSRDQNATRPAGTSWRPQAAEPFVRDHRNPGISPERIKTRVEQAPVYRRGRPDGYGGYTVSGERGTYPAGAVVRDHRN